MTSLSGFFFGMAHHIDRALSYFTVAHWKTKPGRLTGLYERGIERNGTGLSESK